jgi:tRNA pseudouridine55 synthase
VPVKSREIVIHELAVTEVNLPYVSFRVRASKGTYIRSLAADLGRRLRTGACLERLRRLSAAPFSIDDAVTMEEAEELADAGQLDRRFIPLDRALSFLPEVCVSGQMAKMVSHGRPLPLSALDSSRLKPGPVRIEAEGQGLLAVYEYNPPSRTRENECLIPLRVLGSH